MRKSRPEPSKRELADGGAGPRVGAWVWACRCGFESTLVDELARAGAWGGVLAPGLVWSTRRPEGPPVFARVGFEIDRLLEDGPTLGLELATHWQQPVWVQIWVPDSDAGNAWSGRATDLTTEVLRLRAQAGVAAPTSARAAEAQGVPLAQCVLVPGGQVITGSVVAGEASPFAPGGRMRMGRDRASPSRAAMKLEEALTWLRLAPGPGEVCVDLGSAPGGWAERLLKLGARVIAVDPARLRPELMGSSRLRHEQVSAFQFAPAEPVDWLFCDMAWRPREVAQLLAKWARQSWALHLVANLKLPMRDRLPMVEEVLSTLRTGGWKDLRARQLYHDREEITVVGRTR